MLGCVYELQASLGAAATAVAATIPALNLSPAWIMAAAKRFAPRLDTLCHIFQLQPQLATDVFQQRPKSGPVKMVRMTFRIMLNIVLITNRLNYHLPV